MNENSNKKSQIAITGEKLGVVEEFLADKYSTYVKDGEIRAAKTGMIYFNREKCKIEIETHQGEHRKTVREGDIVFGTVAFIRKYSIGVIFYTINGKLLLNSPYMGNIHVSQISHKYVDNISEAFQLTDIIRAKVVAKEGTEYSLSTIGKEFGVVHADCIICGETLEKIDYNKLRCPRCGHVESRKLALDYRNVEHALRF
ncbi:MAG: exosome complex RNA-binding protein Csl4 [Promethearchaeota archaeon]